MIFDTNLLIHFEDIVTNNYLEADNEERKGIRQNLQGKAKENRK
jgi:hypothetical protein